MAPKDKVTLKEIKGPDEFQVWMGKVVEFFRLYGAWVGAGAGLVLVAIVGGVLLSRHAETSRIDVARDFDKAFAPVMAVETRKAEPPAGEDAAKADEAKKRAEEDAAKLKAAAADLDKVAAIHKDSPVAKVAVLGKAAAALNAGDSPAALQAYQAYVTANPDSSLNVVAWEALGLAADRAGKRDEAEKAFNEMAKAPSALIRSYAYLHLGDLYNPGTQVQAGAATDVAKAREFYEKGAKEVPGGDDLLAPAPLLAKKTLEERLLGLR